jgi:hypothetical protein
MDPQTKQPVETPSDWNHDPFPQPRTIPTGWELSEYNPEDKGYLNWKISRQSEGSSEVEA